MKIDPCDSDQGKSDKISMIISLTVNNEREKLLGQKEIREGLAAKGASPRVNSLTEAEHQKKEAGVRTWRSKSGGRDRKSGRYADETHFKSDQTSIAPARHDVPKYHTAEPFVVYP